MQLETQGKDILKRPLLDILGLRDAGAVDVEEVELRVTFARMPGPEFVERMPVVVLKLG